MNCQQVAKLLERYDEGELPPQISTQVESHLHHCVGCQTMLRLVEKERVSLQSTDDIPALNPDFAQGVMSRISVTPRPKLYPLVPVWVEWTRRYPTLLGAAAVILLFLFPLIGQPTINNEFIPPTQQAAKKVAAVNQMQNVPYNATILPLTETSDENSYRDETLRPLDPSRSLQAKVITGSSALPSSPSTPTAALATGNAATDQTDDTQVIAPTVVPSYIPTGYTLDKIEITSGNQVIVSYQTSKDQPTAPLIINIVPELSNKKLMLEKDTTTRTDQPVIKAEDNVKPPVLATSVRSLTEPTKVAPVVGSCGGYNYLITSNIPLESQEMENLSRSLELR
ncbi:MAG: anti-sigma factor family protein [Methanomassiliicoccales archaeon]